MKVNVLKIRKLQKEKGLKAYELARMAGILPGSLSNLNKSGNCYPITAMALADALGVDLNELIVEE